MPENNVYYHFINKIIGKFFFLLLPRSKGLNHKLPGVGYAI